MAADEEEFKAQLKAKADAVKADIKAGRYRNGEIHPHINATAPIVPATAEERETCGDDMLTMMTLMYGMIEPSPRFHEIYTSRWSSKYPSIEEIPRRMIGRRADMVIMDDLESLSTKAQKISYERLLKRRFFHDIYGPTPVKPAGPPKPEPDWKRKTFLSGPETPPNSAKRKALRAKRKKSK